MNFLFSRSSWVTAAALAALFGVFCFHESAGIAFPYVNLDEQGHVSYALHLAQSLEFFPSLTQMRLYDFEQLRWSAEPNFINHPSLGYHTLGLFTDFGSVGPHVRTASIAFFALGFAAILFGLHAAGIFSNLGLVAAAMFCVLLKVQRFGETFSNDSVAFFGGGLVFLGTALLWSRQSSFRAAQFGLALGGIGLAFCIAAKLNSALLAGAFVLASLALFALGRRAEFRRHSRLLLALLSLLCIAAALPYILLAQEFGTPAPNTPGQIKMLADGGQGGRLGFASYLLQSLMGALENAGSDAMVTYALFAIVTSGAAMFLSVRRSSETASFPLQPFARAAAAATVLTLALHLNFSFQRHVQHGWQPELYPRYYFPLLGPYLLLFLHTVGRLGPFKAFAAEESGRGGI